MKPIANLTMRVVFWGLAFSVLAVAMAVVPLKADAAEIGVQTQQILPPGGANTCVQMSVTAFTPYMYDNALHSFEFTVPDASYVAVGGSVGGTFTPLRLMTRRINPSGALRVHVDIATTPIRGTVPIQVTLLSSRGPGSPTCLSVVSMSISGPTQSSSPATSPATVIPPTSIGTLPQTSRPASSTSESVATGSSSSATANSASSTAAARGTSVLQTSFANICSSQEGTYRLWLVLLGLYILIAVALLWPEWPSTWVLVRRPEWRLAGLLIPLVLLLALWYFSPTCRSAWWMPLVAVAIAAIGSFMALRNDPRMNQLLLIEPPKK